LGWDGMGWDRLGEGWKYSTCLEGLASLGWLLGKVKKNRISTVRIG
jgi:hypothetical protein